jgi:predicted transposase/invertase (TIGR01784 family)
VEYLKPTTDLVFKLLLLRDKELVLLRSMLECVLEPPSPITDIEILNPEVEIDYPADKPIALDIRAKLRNLTRIDIEMQTELRARSASRFLYYWSREFGLGLKRGDDYSQLIPVISILWLGQDLLQSEQFHSVFHLSEDATQERFSSDIEIHALELEKLHFLSAVAHPRLYRWSRFLLSRTEQQFELLSKEDPIMSTAKKSLEDLSADDDVRLKAYERETALRGHLHTIAAERAEGRVEGQRSTLVRLLVKRFGELPAWADERLSHASPEQLEAYLDAVLTAPSLEAALQLNA